MQVRQIFSLLKIRVLLILFSVLCLLFVSCGQKPAPPGGKVLIGITPFNGGTFEASGVTDVPGTDGVLFVDNGRAGQVLWMTLAQNGGQVGEIKPFVLGADIEDIEGITSDGTHFYVVSSQSRPKAIASVGLVRFKFNARNQTIEGVESISGLKRFLVENVAELRQEGDRKGKDGGLNIEGLAWDAQRRRLLLGLRSPVVDGNALLVPLRLRDPRGAFSTDNLEVEGSKAIRVAVDGGIRSVEYDSRAKVFLIISGAPEDQKQTDFGLWEWNGNEKEPVLRETHRFDNSLKAEGVARATAGNRDFVLIVFDAGGYTIMDRSK
jgi:Protein of unknown function (DUF3616)